MNRTYARDNPDSDEPEAAGCFFLLLVLAIFAGWVLLGVWLVR